MAPFVAQASNPWGSSCFRGFVALAAHDTSAVEDLGAVSSGTSGRPRCRRSYRDGLHITGRCRFGSRPHRELSRTTFGGDNHKCVWVSTLEDFLVCVTEKRLGVRTPVPVHGQVHRCNGEEQPAPVGATEASIQDLCCRQTTQHSGSIGVRGRYREAVGG